MQTPALVDRIRSPRTTPASRDDCKNDGWKTYGFNDQGHCVSAVNQASNGPDSTARHDDREAGNIPLAWAPTPHAGPSSRDAPRSTSRHDPRVGPL